MKNSHPDMLIHQRNAEKVRTRYFLSKTIDGLENSTIVDNCLTTKTVSMMTFKRRRITEKNEKNIEYESFFRETATLEEYFHRVSSLPSRIYLANLRRHKSSLTLKNDYLCLKEADSNGNLLENKKENFLFVKMLKCENENGEKQHLPLCLKCNHDEKAKVLMDSITWKLRVSSSFKKDNFAACKYAMVAEILFTKEDSQIENNSLSMCKVIETNEKQHLSVSFDGNTHGLIFANIARGAKRGHCSKCKSIRCSHLKRWDEELKKKVLPSLEKDELNLETETSKESASEDWIETNDEEISITHPPKRLVYPFDDIVQAKMRILDSSDFSNLTEFISKPRTDEKCLHGFTWSQDDPRAHNWIFSENIKIAHSSYVTKKKEKPVFKKRWVLVTANYFTMDQMTCFYLHQLEPSKTGR